MAKLVSFKEFSHSVNDSICAAFGFPLNSAEYEVCYRSWGSIVKIFSGENAGTYDIEMVNGVYEFLEA